MLQQLHGGIINMKIDFDNNKTRKRIGLAMIILAVLILVFSIISMVSKDEADEAGKSQTPSAEVTEEEREMIRAEAVNNANGEEDIKKEDAQKIMNLKVHMPDELCELYLGGDQERLYREIEAFLIEYDFYMDVEQAVCTQVITKNHKKNISYLEFDLDDPARTVLTLEYQGNQDRYIFNYR